MALGSPAVHGRLASQPLSAAIGNLLDGWETATVVDDGTDTAAVNRCELGTDTGVACGGQAGSAVASFATGQVIRGKDGRARTICGAKSRGGHPCRVSPMSNGRCRIHGGAAQKGMAASNFKHGRYSKYLAHLPHELRRGYATMVSDKDLLSLREEVGLLTIRLSTLLDDITAADSVAPAWALTGDAVARLRTAHASTGPGRALAITEALDALDDLVRCGADASVVQRRLWLDVRELIQEKVRVTSAEWKRLVDMQAVITVDQALQFAMGFMSAAKEVVTDKDVLSKLQERTLHLIPKDA